MSQDSHQRFPHGTVKTRDISRRRPPVSVRGVPSSESESSLGVLEVVVYSATDFRGGNLPSAP